MDIALLNFFNQTMTHPFLDKVMIGLTIGGFALLPSLGVVLCLNPKHRKTGIIILISLGLGFILTIIFQYLTLRPRPDTVRLLLTTPNFPSYPSGHAVAAFSVAIVIGLTYRQLRWWVIALLGATLIAYSRVYLGHHYPTDVVGGAILGAAIGAACYGLCGLSGPDWRWLLWPQMAIVSIISQIAYLDILPTYFLRWPMADKVLHFLLFGACVFWLNLWLKGQSIRFGWGTIPIAIILPLSIAMIEEGLQYFSPLRTADLGDLASDLGGMLFFWGLSYIIITRPQRIEPDL